MKRIYHHYTKHECLKAGLLKNGKDVQKIKHSIDVLSDPIMFYDLAKVMLAEYKFSAEHNMTNKGHNRKAWLGHVTCLHNHGANMEETIEAWQCIGSEAQKNANNIASALIREYEASLKGEECQSGLWG